MPAYDPRHHDGILKGLYRFNRGPSGLERKAHLLGSGAIMYQVLEAQAVLERYGVSADVWSATSYSELGRDALACERWNRLHPSRKARKPYVEALLEKERGAFVAASDYMAVLPQSISQWVPGGLVSLGTDGFGLSESRAQLRTHFEVDARYIAVAVLHRLHTMGEMPAKELKRAFNELDVDPEKASPAAS